MKRASRTPRRHRSRREVLTTLVLLALAAGYGLWRQYGTEPVLEAGSGVATAFEERRSGVWVEEEGVVERLLEDDREGSRHQRFILRLPSAHTVLVSHNIDLAPRAPVALGTRLRLRGRYEWNERGGVVHWTHHDPRGERQGGWLEVAGEIFR